MNGFTLNNISNCYVGSAPASAIYIGSQLIWPSTPPPHDYSQDYLTFTALENTTFTFTTNALQYSLDDGNTWTTLAANTASSTVTTGNKILWKQTGLTPTSVNGIGKFSATGNFDASGNIMSLYYGDNFINQNDLTGKSYAFYRLFYNCNKLVNTENLILPATTLASLCYFNMFYGCTSLTTAPELPANTLTTGCYEGMFQGCSSLVTAPELSATTLANSCYGSMFMDCTSLSVAPELPATTLIDSCYHSMFSWCTSLTTAPELPVDTLVDNCYKYMFQFCSSLNYIKCLANDIYATDCTYKWVDGVAATGTFVREAGMLWTTDDSGIPSGWTVVDNIL